MNDPSAQPIDIEEQRAWLNEHKQSTQFSWKQLAERTGVKLGSLTPFATNNYGAPGGNIAAAIFRYRQTLAAQAALKVEMPDIPSYFETETSQRLSYLFGHAQRGRIIAAALSPGLGKTMTAKHYQACNSNVFLVTASPASASLTSMMNSVLQALGKTSASYVSYGLERVITDRLRDLGNPLLIVDEAQHLKDRSIEEIRSWHDATGLGVALLGNAGLLQTLEGGSRAVSKAQLFSRISLRMERWKPLQADIEALLNAWEIDDRAMAEFVQSIAVKPGGLRGATFAIELAHMIARAAREDLAVSHIRDAWAQLSVRATGA